MKSSSYLSLTQLSPRPTTPSRAPNSHQDRRHPLELHHRAHLEPKLLHTIYMSHLPTQESLSQSQYSLTPSLPHTHTHTHNPCLLHILKAKLHNHPLGFGSFANWPIGVSILQYNHLEFLNW